MENYETFRQRCTDEIALQGEDAEFRQQSLQWMARAETHRYAYHFEWMGRPIIQYPQDIVALQEIIWKVRPEVIIETGIAHGGSMIFYASMLELLAQCGMIRSGRVIGVDIDIRQHNRQALEAHPMARRITLIEGSSVAENTLDAVRKASGEGSPCMVALDSNHTHAHVLAELHAYTPFVSVGSYCVVFDTSIEYVASPSGEKPWGKGNSPLTAVETFLRGNKRFAPCRETHNKLNISECIGGYLCRIK